MFLKNLSLSKKLILTFCTIMAGCFLASVVVFVQLFVGDFTGSQLERQDAIMTHIEAVCAKAVLGHQALTSRATTLSIPAGSNPAFDRETLDIHDEEAVEAAGLPDAQIGIRVK